MKKIQKLGVNLTGMDGLNLNPMRLQTLESLLNRYTKSDFSIISANRLRSRKNVVLHLTIQSGNEANPHEVVAKMFMTDRFANELSILQRSMKEGLAVPKIIEAGNGVILMTYIPGATFTDQINRTFEYKSIEKLATWYRNYHRIHGLIKGDPRLRNFICTKNDVFGLDFEESKAGHWILDIAGASASLLDTNPIFDSRKCALSWHLLESYLSLLDEKRSSKIDMLFINTVSETLQNTAFWRKSNEISNLAKNVRLNGIPFE